MDTTLKKHVDSAEGYIRELERLYDNFQLDKETLDTYIQKLHAIEKYASTVSHKEWDWNRSSEQATAQSAAWTYSFQLLRSRLLELRAVIAFASDEPSKAREYILSAKQKLPRKSDRLISGLGVTVEATTATNIEWGPIVRNVLIVLGIAVFVWAMVSASHHPSNYEEEPDYCDRAICK